MALRGGVIGCGDVDGMQRLYRSICVELEGCEKRKRWCSAFGTTGSIACVTSMCIQGLEGARSVRNDGSWRLMRSGFFDREQVLFSWVGSLE